MSGAAPGAKVVSVRACLFTAGCTTHALVEGMIWVVETADVDVVNMSIGGLPALNDGNNARAVLYNRLIEDNNVQMFISAGNSGPGENTIGDPAVATKVMAVGAYIHKETWQRDYGSDADFVDNMHPFSSRGPAEDGALKPQIIAPGAAVSSVPTWQAGQPVVGTYTLPPGYGMFNGTSMAAPQSAGAAALLLSAARARGFTRSAAQLRNAFNSTARFIPGYTAADQGNGLIDVNRAWDLYRDGPETVNITSRVAVHTILSDFLAGAGLRPGDLRPRGRHARPELHARVHVHPHVGPEPAGALPPPVGRQRRHVRHAEQPAATPEPADDAQRAGQPDDHGGPLRDPQARQLVDGRIDYATMNTVIVPDELTAANGFSVTKTGMAGRDHVQRFFFRVPAGSPVLKVDMTGPSPTRALARSASCASTRGGWSRQQRQHSCYMPAVAGCSTGSPLSRTFADTTAGVWEVTVEARRTSDVPWAPFTLTASLFGVEVSRIRTSSRRLRSAYRYLGRTR